MIFKGEIAMKLGFDIEIYNNKYNEKIVNDKISDVLDDAMGVFLDDTCIMTIVKETLSDVLETRAAVRNVALKTHKVFNRSDDLFLKCEAEFDYVGHKNVENMDVSDVLKEVVLDISMRCIYTSPVRVLRTSKLMCTSSKIVFSVKQRLWGNKYEI